MGGDAGEKKKKKKKSGEKRDKEERKKKSLKKKRLGDGDDEDDDHDASELAINDLHDPGGQVPAAEPKTDAQAIQATLNFKPTGEHFVIGGQKRKGKDYHAVPFGLDRAGFESLEVETITDAVTQDDIDWLDIQSELRTQDGRTVVGLACCTSDDGKQLLGLALSTHRKALYIQCAFWTPDDIQRNSEVLKAFLLSADILCVGLDLALTVLAIRRFLNIDSCGVDVCSATPMEAKSPSATAQALFTSLPGIIRLFQYTYNLPDLTKKITEEEPDVRDEDYSAGYGALRAWLALTCAVHTRRWRHVQDARELDTRRVGLQQINFFLDSYQIQVRLEALKPRTALAEMAAEALRANQKGEIDLENAKFSSKIRVDAAQTLKLTLSDGRVIDHATATRTKGRHTFIKGSERQAEIVSVEVQGRASNTLADMMWRVYMRLALSGAIDVHDSDIINEIYWTNTRRGHARRLAIAKEVLADKPEPLPILPNPENEGEQATEEPSKAETQGADEAKASEDASDTKEQATAAISGEQSEGQRPEGQQVPPSPSEAAVVPAAEVAPATEPEGPPTSHAADRLNRSQRKAHDAITSGLLPVCLVQGPPGTGKTSVISATVQTWLLRNDEPKCIYVCAKNNVAAQNIADSLKHTGFDDFRLIVSGDFYIDWHEHRYSLKKQLVVSNQLGPKVEEEEIDELMGGVRVVLCTLAVLSSHNFMENGFFQKFRPYCLLIDEASQIRCDELPFALERFKRTLQNVAFFGDNKQLAPYHASQVRAIKSIFDMPHLQPYTIFLNTQYRLPSRVGDFISTYVYGSALRSASNTSANRDCVKFVDVAEGEEEKSGTSTINTKEVEVIIALVSKYYGESSFKILTPYDAQRNAIETALQKNNLPWQDRVFNVDSFQGQEDDIILISLVKTKQLGFLNELRRSNVMLTRLKKAMVIVSQRLFLDTTAFKTLIGRMAVVFRIETPNSWVDAKDVLEGNAEMPERVVPNKDVFVSDAAGLGQYGLDWEAAVVNGEREAAASTERKNVRFEEDRKKGKKPRRLAAAGTRDEEEDDVKEPGKLDFDSYERELTEEDMTPAEIQVETEAEAANRPKSNWAADDQEEGLPALSEQWLLDAQALPQQTKDVELVDDESVVRPETVEEEERKQHDAPDEIDAGLEGGQEDNADAEAEGDTARAATDDNETAAAPAFPPGLPPPGFGQLSLPPDLPPALPPLPAAFPGESEDLEGSEVRERKPKLDLIWSVPGEDDESDSTDVEDSEGHIVRRDTPRPFQTSLTWDPTRVPPAAGWEDSYDDTSAVEPEPDVETAEEGKAPADLDGVDPTAMDSSESRRMLKFKEEQKRKRLEREKQKREEQKKPPDWADDLPRDSDAFIAGLWDGSIKSPEPARANRGAIPGMPQSAKAATVGTTADGKKSRKRKAVKKLGGSIIV